MITDEKYDPDLDLEAEIEAFLEDDEENSFGMEDDLIQPIWRVELNTVLDEQILDVDILKGIIGSRVLPNELRAQVWPSLLGVRGKNNSFDKTSLDKSSMDNNGKQLLRSHCQRFGPNAELGELLISTYIKSKDIKYESVDLVLILQLLIDLELGDDLFNSYYAVASRFRPRASNQIVSIIDLLVQYFDPFLSRQIQAHRLDITHHASTWVNSIFCNCLSPEVAAGIWDILFQSSDSSLTIFISLVFIMNHRDELLSNKTLPKLDEINVGDIDDLIQLAKFYQSKAPKSFIRSVIWMLFGIKSANFNVGKSISDKMDIKSQFVIPISANELVKDVLNATAGIILDIRPDDHFEHSHLIGSLRIKCCIDSGLVDTGNLRIALEKFTSDINRELSKDEDQEIPFLTLVGMREPDSTLFTCANELIRMGFVGVSAVEGGFESIVQEVQAIGSEDLLLWRNPDDPLLRQSEDSNYSWFSNPLTSNFSSALNSINSTLENILTIEDNLVDDQF